MPAPRRISECVWQLGDPDNPETPRPLLSIEEFFEGNEAMGSIGCNLPDEPSPAQFYALFSDIAQREDVKDIRVSITAFDDPEWPFSDTVYVMTTATAQTVATWFPDELAPDEVWEGVLANEACEPYIVPAGCRTIACWWD